jgi:hypothetical protein
MRHHRHHPITGDQAGRGEQAQRRGGVTVAQRLAEIGRDRRQVGQVGQQRPGLLGQRRQHLLDDERPQWITRLGQHRPPAGDRLTGQAHQRGPAAGRFVYVVADLGIAYAVLGGEQVGDLIGGERELGRAYLGQHAATAQAGCGNRQREP